MVTQGLCPQPPPSRRDDKYQHFHSIFEGIKKILGVKALFERYSIKILESIITIQNDIEMLMADNHRVFKSIQRASWSEWGLTEEEGEGKKVSTEASIKQKIIL